MTDRVSKHSDDITSEKPVIFSINAEKKDAKKILHSLKVDPKTKKIPFQFTRQIRRMEYRRT